MREVSFSLSPVDEKPRRKYREGGKYDAVIDGFLAGNDSLVTVDVAGRKAGYVRSQLKKRIDARELDVTVSVAGGKAYLEKTVD